MAVNFTQQQKRQKYLLLILAALVFLILLVVWLGLFRKPGASLPMAAPLISPLQSLEINWQVLQDEKLKELKLIEQIPEFEEGVGRNNPFIPY